MNKLADAFLPLGKFRHFERGIQRPSVSQKLKRRRLGLNTEAKWKTMSVDLEADDMKFSGRKGALSKMYCNQRRANGENRKTEWKTMTIRLDRPIRKVLG